MSDKDANRDESADDEATKLQEEISSIDRGSFQNPSSHRSSRSSRKGSDLQSPSLRRVKSPASSYKEKVARAITSGKRSITPDESLEDLKQYSSPGGPRRNDYQKEGGSPASQTMVKNPTPSESVENEEKSNAERSFEVTSPALSKRAASSTDKEAVSDFASPDKGKRITSPLSGYAKSPSSSAKLKSPSLPDKSQYTSDLSIYASASEGKGHDINNSSAEVDLFYSVENSPGEKKDKTERQISAVRNLPEHEQPGFSILDDLVLHKNVEDSIQPNDDFNDIIRDHVSNYGGTTNASECDTDGTASNVFKKAVAAYHGKPVDDDAEPSTLKDKNSDTLESIPLTKESDDNEDPNENNMSGVDAVDNAAMENPPILPKRHVLLLMLFLGFAVVYSLRVNINVAIVAMVNNKTRLNKNGRIEIIQAEFNWNSHSQALVVGAFYYGYWILQVPGAWIAMKLGATRIFGYGVLLSSLLSLITPVATRYHLLALVGVRVAQGLVLGVTYPCVIAIWANWAPPLERSTMVTITMAGSPVGNIIAIPITGILAKYGFDGGWPSVFYFFGSLGLLWYVVWELTIYDTPQNHPGISIIERKYIEKSIGAKPFDPLKESLPWIAIFTSLPMWGIIVGHFGACWGYYTLFTQMPTYLKDIQHLDIKTMGLVASTPYLLKAFLGPVGGIVADMLLKGGYMSVRAVRILFYGIGCIFAGFFILMTGYYSRKGEAIAFLILGVGFSGLNTTGYAVNHLDLAPRYAGILMGISNTFATIPGFLSPMVTGFITKHKRASEWKIVFWITFIVYVVAVILYSFMCSGDKQWWFEGYPQDMGESEEEDEKESDDDGHDENDKGYEDNKDTRSVASSKTNVSEHEKSISNLERKFSSRKGSDISPTPPKMSFVNDEKSTTPSNRHESPIALSSSFHDTKNADRSTPIQQSHSEVINSNSEDPQKKLDSMNEIESDRPRTSSSLHGDEVPSKPTTKSSDRKGSIHSMSSMTLPDTPVTKSPSHSYQSVHSLDIRDQEEPTDVLSGESIRHSGSNVSSPAHEKPHASEPHQSSQHSGSLKSRNSPAKPGSLSNRDSPAKSGMRSPVQPTSP